MRLPRGAHCRIVTKPSGRRVKQIVDQYDRVIETVPITHKVQRTGVGRRLAKRRRRIAR